MRAPGFPMRVLDPCRAIRWEGLPNGYGRIEGKRWIVRSGDWVPGTYFGIRAVLVGDTLAGRG